MEIDPPITTITISTTRKKRNKCHGNRKLQRFKRKCRHRGLNAEQIQQLMVNRQNNSRIDPNQQQEKRKKRKSSQRTNEETNTTVRLLSQLSIFQQQSKPKKRKLEQEHQMTTTATSVDSIPMSV